ncbi:MAG TPA: hypothetical protein VHZ07_14630 [Bryobacteraceae bacterium]|nr:hypothetical protein [Bryobacteraceae bacterium]
MRKLHPSLHAETLSKKWMELIVNLDNFGSMGIMFLARRARVRPIWSEEFADGWKNNPGIYLCLFGWKPLQPVSGGIYAGTWQLHCCARMRTVFGPWTCFLKTAGTI